MSKAGARGGRRHGLSASGESRAISVRLGPDERAALDELCMALDMGPSDVIRLAIGILAEDCRRDIAGISAHQLVEVMQGVVEQIFGVTADAPKNPVD